MTPEEWQGMTIARRDDYDPRISAAGARLSDLFAAAALVSLVRCPHVLSGELASESYGVADAMLEEREKREAS